MGMVRRFSIVAIAVALGVFSAPIGPWATLVPVARAFDDHIAFSRGSTVGPGQATGADEYAQAFAAIEITGFQRASGGPYALYASDSGIPLSWSYKAGYAATGAAQFSMSGSFDPVANSIEGRFSVVIVAGGVIGGTPAQFGADWRGEVSGSVTGSSAALTFSGQNEKTCTIEGECAESGNQKMTVWFEVADSAPTSVPEDKGDNVVLVSGASGDVYLSPASEADLEPAQRTWQAVKPGDRIALAPGVMLRTGKNGTLKITFSDTSHIRLQNSTLFSVEKMVWPETSQKEMYTRLYEGIAFYYMRQWRENNKKFEVDVDRAIVTIEGTTFSVAVTDSAAVVAVSEGHVTLTHKATSAVTDVFAGEQATVGDSGVTKSAATSLPPDDEATAPPSGTSASAAVPNADPASGSGSGDGTTLVVVGLLLAAAAMLLAAALLWQRPGRRT